MNPLILRQHEPKRARNPVNPDQPAQHCAIADVRGATLYANPHHHGAPGGGVEDCLAPVREAQITAGPTRHPAHCDKQVLDSLIDCWARPTVGAVVERELPAVGQRRTVPSIRKRPLVERLSNDCRQRVHTVPSFPHAPLLRA
ncbi:hypothetical protein G6F24_015681 [Rhizopus arrhizus]|nr:hypothetical protein G6F24_015681 [Rhizopus arrhizus]